MQKKVWSVEKYPIYSAGIKLLLDDYFGGGSIYITTFKSVNEMIRAVTVGEAPELLFVHRQHDFELKDILSFINSAFATSPKLIIYGAEFSEKALRYVSQKQINGAFLLSDSKVEMSRVIEDVMNDKQAVSESILIDYIKNKQRKIGKKTAADMTLLEKKYFQLLHAGLNKNAIAMELRLKPTAFDKFVNEITLKLKNAI